MDNILTDNNFVLDNFNPSAIVRNIAKNLKARRLESNITQEELSQKSGVSLGSIKRFENKFAISLKHLLMIAVVLDATDEFSQLFTKKQYTSIAEISRGKETMSRKRARRNDKKQ